jgi:hypothetical protein
VPSHSALNGFLIAAVPLINLWGVGPIALGNFCENQGLVMKLLLQEIRRNPLLWLLVFVPIALAAEKLKPGFKPLLYGILVGLVLTLFLKETGPATRKT